MRHRFGTVGVIGGHMVLTLGLALILQPTPEALAAAAVFGALIGALKIYARDLQTVGVLLPIAAATLISALAFWIAPDQTIDGSMRILIPALVTFIPGSLLTTATLDLSAGEVISGSSRLVAGTMQLVLLSFGIAVGALIAGVSLDKALTNEAKNTLGDWAPWLGVIVFGIGAFVHFSGPPRSLGWLLVVLLAAWIGQQIGGRLVSDTLGAFFGALIATPVAAWVATRPSGPPALASFLPAFWLLVPGAVGLIGMAEFVGSNRAAGLDHFVNSLITFISIGIGVLVGNALVLRLTAPLTRLLSPVRGDVDPPGAGCNGGMTNKRPTVWIVLSCVLAAAVVGLGIWAFSAQSDADDARAELATAQEHAANGREADAGRRGNARSDGHARRHGHPRGDRDTGRDGHARG